MIKNCNYSDITRIDIDDMLICICKNSTNIDIVKHIIDTFDITIDGKDIETIVLDALHHNIHIGNDIMAYLIDDHIINN